jgi:hypothetical protein
MKGVDEQQFAQPPALRALVNSEATDQRHRQRVLGQLPLKGFGDVRRGDEGHTQGVVAEHRRQGLAQPGVR